MNKHVHCLVFSTLRIDETFSSIILQGISKGGKEKERKDPSQKPKNPNWITKGQGNKLCSRDPTGLKKHIREGNGQAWYQHW
jgi:hypothetical protein